MCLLHPAAAPSPPAAEQGSISVTLAEVSSSTANLGEGKSAKLHLPPCLCLHWEGNIGKFVALKTGIHLGLVISEDADKRLKHAKEQWKNLLRKTGVTLMGLKLS